MEIIFPSNIKCIACSSPIPKTNTYSLCKKCFKSIEFINDDCSWHRTKDGELIYSDEPFLKAETNIKIDIDRDSDIKESERYLYDVQNKNLFDYKNDADTMDMNSIKTLECIYTCLKYENAVKKLIHSFKYSNQTYLSKIFASMMKGRLDMLSLKTDYIICVPSSKKRLNERGYNQTELIGRYLSKKMQIPLIHPVIRKKHTKALSGLNPIERELELSGAFELNDTNQELDYKNLLIIDDILTTGATLEKMAAVIKEKYPSATIYAIVLADGKKV